MRRSAAPWARPLRLLPYFDEAVLGTGHCALDEQQVALRVDLVHDETDLCHALAAEAACHLDAFEHARRCRRRADRAGLADVVRAVRLRAAVELVPLDRSGEALAVGDAAHLDLLAGLEDLDGDVLADDELTLSAELEQVPVRTVDVVLLEVTELGLGDLALGHLVVRDLHGVVAVRVRRLHLHDGTRRGFDHRHRRDDARLRVEDAGHAELLADDAFHSLISMSTPAGRSSR